jgi:hypothetical protein
MNTFDSQHASLIDYGEDSLESNPFADTPSQRESTISEPSFSQQPIVATATNTELNTNQLEPEGLFEDENIYTLKEEQNQDKTSEQPSPTQINTGDLVTNQLDELTLDSPSQMEQHEHYQQPEETETDTQVCFTFFFNRHLPLLGSDAFNSQNLCKSLKAVLDLISRYPLKIRRK